MRVWPQLGAGAEPHVPRETQKRIEEYAVECSILKVYGSEMLSLVADELVATMGGYGYVEEYPAERFYRDARINRIFEGTNEINRLIITGWLMKRAMSGKLPLLAAIKKLMDEVMQPPALRLRRGRRRTAGARGRGAGRRQEDRAVRRRRRQPALHDRASGSAGSDGRSGRHHHPGLCAGVGAAARAQDGRLRRHASAEVAAAMTGLLADETMALAEQAARRVLAACGEGDMLRTQLAILRRLARFTPADAVALSRTVARHCIQVEKYPF